MKKIICTAIIVLLLSILLVNTLSMLNISVFGLRWFKIGSGSMEPTLKVNDIILIKKENEYYVDDIITFKDSNEIVTHRIIDINKEKITTKGDANNKEDKPITKNLIIGKLVFKFRIFGFIGYLLSKPLSWILLFVIGLGITIMIPDKK